MLENKLLNRNKEYLAVIIIFLVCFVLYSKSLSVPFVFDDGRMIVKNNFIKDFNKVYMLFTSGKMTSVPIAKGMYRPFLMLTFVFNYFFGRLNPTGYHIINIAIHFLNAVLVFFLLRSLLQNNFFWPSFLTSLLFVVHPINSEAVIYISCRSTLLSSFFFLVGLISYIHSNFGRFDKAYWISLAVFILGLLTKEVIIVFPLILLVYDFLFRKDNLKDTQASIKRYFLFIFVVLIYLLLKYHLFGAIANIGGLRRSLYSNFFTQLHVSVFYLKLFFCPLNLCIGRRFPEFSSLLNPDALQSFLVIISLISISIASYKRLPLLSFAILWFFVNLLPKFIATLSLLAAEQHLYLPAIGIFIAITLFLERLFYIVEARKKQALKILIASVATVILIFFSVLTIRRNNIWKDEYSLWLNNVGCSPSSMAGYNNLGLAALNKGKINEAENYFIIALEEIKKRPIIPRALKIRLHLNLSSTYLEKDDFDLAEEHLREALAINPNIAEIHNNLGLLFAKKGLRDKEIYHLKRAIELDPSFVLAYNNLGVSYYYEGEIDLAIETLKTAIKVNPDYSKPYIGLAFIYEKLGNLGEAVYFKSRALELLNGSALDYYKLGIVYGELGDKRAVEAFKKAISLEPKFAAAHNNLAVTYANLEPPENDLARKHAKLALKYGYKVDPNFLKQLRIPDFK